ncbi:class I SAM-dependent methyltransferase [Salinicoccus siamensis]|uniref:Class I SAM-dependent methyltransferase n=1 Tax=Salinicoccus siamensis TaxID=381830 RepID=A0ABV5Z0G2_9STAP
MKANWAETYYKRQFELMRSNSAYPANNFFEEEVSLLLEQVGRPSATVLELGAGRSDIANILARQDRKIVTIELVEEICGYAKKHAHQNVQALCGDFYTIKLQRDFDLILYLDGFGVGNDDDQSYLLQRIFNWLSDDGYALIDIYQPLYWQKIAGQEMYPFGIENIIRKYDYDEAGNRMTDTWWEKGKENETITQSLACYSPEQIYTLCEKAGLQIIAYYPSGAIDFETGAFQKIASLDECLSYRIKLKKN